MFADYAGTSLPGCSQPICAILSHTNAGYRRQLGAYGSFPAQEARYVPRQHPEHTAGVSHGVFGGWDVLLVLAARVCSRAVCVFGTLPAWALMGDVPLHLHGSPVSAPLREPRPLRPAVQTLQAEERLDVQIQ